MATMFAFSMAEPLEPREAPLTGPHDPERQRATWQAGRASLHAACTRSPVGYRGCSAEDWSITCNFSGVGWETYECDYL